VAYIAFILQYLCWIIAVNDSITRYPVSIVQVWKSLGFWMNFLGFLGFSVQRRPVIKIITHKQYPIHHSSCRVVLYKSYKTQK